MTNETGAGTGPRSGLRETASVVLLVGREALAAFSKNGNLNSAATLAYYGFLSLMPLLLVAVIVLSVVMHSSQTVLDAVGGLMSQLFPSFSESILGDLLAVSRRKVWGLVSVLVLLWSVTPFVGAIRACMARTFRTESALNFFKAKMYDMAAVLSILLLFLLLVAGKIVYSLRPVDLAQAGPLAGAIKSVGLFLVVSVVLGFFYVAFSPVRLCRSHLVAGVVTSAVLLGIIRPLFGLVLRFNPDYGFAFGSLKAVFLLIIWVYYTFAVILLGAEVIATARRKEALMLRGLFLSGAKRGGAVLPHRFDRFVRCLDDAEVLFSEGEPGREMFYVLSGSIELTRKGRRLATASPGGYFGEMSMLLDAPRTATATAAARDTRLVAISRDNFDTILAENPEIVQSILKEMAQRLQATNEQVVRANGGA